LDQIEAVPANTEVQAEGLCKQGYGLKAADFSWQSPTSLGGDFIASSTSQVSPVTLAFGDEICTLSAIALTTSGWPALRLQFEECAGKAAIEVSLMSQAQGGMKIINWLCAVTAGSDLCSKAKQKLHRNGTSAVSVEPVFGQEVLDISSVANAASKGVTHLVAKSKCFENLHWLTLPSGLGIDADEWELLKTMLGLLEPPSYPAVPVAVTAQVESLCFLSCDGTWDEEKCGPLSYTTTTTTKYVAPVAEEVATGELSVERLNRFGDAFSDPDTAPWIWLCLLVAFFIGAALAFVFVRCCMPEPAVRSVPRRVKQVEVQYPDAARTQVLLR